MFIVEGWPYPRGRFVLKRVHLGLREVAFIEGCLHVRGGGVLTSGVAFVEGCLHVRGGLYEVVPLYTGNRARPSIGTKSSYNP